MSASMCVRSVSGNNRRWGSGDGVRRTGGLVLVLEHAADPLPLSRASMNRLLYSGLVQVRGRVLLQARIERDCRINPAYKSVSERVRV